MHLVIFGIEYIRKYTIRYYSTVLSNESHCITFFDVFIVNWIDYAKYSDFEFFANVIYDYDYEYRNIMLYTYNLCERWTTTIITIIMV